MNFLKNLFGGGQRGAGDRFIPVYVLSYRCNEPMASRLNTMSRLSIDDGEHTFYVRKVLHTSGERRCFVKSKSSLAGSQQGRSSSPTKSGWADAGWMRTNTKRALLVFNAPPEETADENETGEEKAER
ncbi:MAG: hypothetical protein R2851_22745 [Caldilineaceae bacterium]